MMRRAHWLAAVGTATVGLAGLAGCQSMGGYPAGSWNGERSLVRAAEPEDPSGAPSLQLRPIQPAAPDPGVSSEDPFAPITVEQFLPATSSGPHRSTPELHGHTAPAGYSSAASTPAPPPAALVPPAPMAVMAPIPSPLMTSGHAWDPHGAMGSTCAGGPGCGTGTSLIENMVIFAGADYFSNSGMLNRDRLFNRAINDLGVIPVDFPDLDPHRTGGMLSINAGAPLTPDGGLGWQIGGTYIESEEGAQGFFTTGVFHRCDPAERFGINWGLVYDVAYDDFIDYVIGQFRFKAGYPLSARNEVGGWLAIGTNVEIVFLPGTDIIVGDPLQIIMDNEIEARVRPQAHGYFFWRHILTSGAEGTVFVGGRENLGGAFIVGYTAQWPMTDCWSILSGGHWSHDSDDRGSYDVYLGVGYYPGGNARSTGVCGNRYLPYQDAANNNVMPMSINPRQIILLGVPPGTASHAPL